ncbi:MAG: hypothetical protein ACYDG6_01150 [Thermincolia bacterium]
MRKPMLVLAIFIIAIAAAAIGPNMFQIEESPKNPQQPPVVVNQQPKTADVSKESDQKLIDAVPEIIVEGTVKSVNVKDRVINFSQEMDDNSLKVGPDVEVLKDAIIIKSSEGKVSLEAVQKGSYVTMVLDKDQRAKSVEISR